MRIVVLVLALAATSCADALTVQTRRALAPPPDLICADGWPLRLFQGPTCAHGICGYTCAPDRWRTP